MRVAGEDDDLGRLELLDAIGVVIDHARRHAVFVGGDLAHPAARAQLDAGADGGGPVGDVGARLRALRAARGAMAEIDALRAAFVIHRGDRAVRRPPVPAELVQPARQRRTGLAQRQRRHHRFVRRIGGIAGQAGHAHHPVVLGVERLQGRVVDRPVIGDAVQRAHAKVRRMEAREVTRVQHRAAADAVEVGDLDRRVVVVDRIVGIARATVRAVVEVVELTRLPVAAGAGIFGRLHPVALLEAEDVHLRLGEAPGHRRAGGAGADDQNVNRGGHAKEPHLKCVAAINGVRVRLSTACCCLCGYPRGGASLPTAHPFWVLPPTFQGPPRLEMLLLALAPPSRYPCRCLVLLGISRDPSGATANG